MTMNRQTDRAVALETRGLRKQFPGRDTPAVDNLELTVFSGEIYALVGESGCGKSTAFRMIAGLLEPEGGTVRIGGREVFGASGSLPCEERRVGMVFQNAALFPHLNLEKNVSFGLRGKRREKRDTARRYLKQVGMEELWSAFPHELSGGQQQRVALARALAMRPELILLDEPFSNLDIRIKGKVIKQTRETLREAGTSSILVTHDINEAFQLAERIGVMRSGTLIQEGYPSQLYNFPADDYVADFLGAVNSLSGSELKIILPGNPDIPEGTYMLRPEEFEIEPVNPENSNAANGVTTASTFFGALRELTVRLDAAGTGGGTVRVRTSSKTDIPVGKPVRLTLTPEALNRYGPGNFAADTITRSVV